MHKRDLNPGLEPTMGPGEIEFQLSFVGNSKNKEIGTLQVNQISAKNVYYGKHSVDAYIKGVLLPEKIKRKVSILRKGPNPKWEIPLRYEGTAVSHLHEQSLE
ncbi:unnamed protein product, partial [Didymodactylos carnosus]